VAAYFCTTISQIYAAQSFSLWNVLIPKYNNIQSQACNQSTCRENLKDNFKNLYKDFDLVSGLAAFRLKND
jgi:hypothetical protein